MSPNYHVNYLFLIRKEFKVNIYTVKVDIIYHVIDLKPSNLGFQGSKSNYLFTARLRLVKVITKNKIMYFLFSIFEYIKSTKQIFQIYKKWPLRLRYLLRFIFTTEKKTYFSDL